jgi:hypothetical protein
MGFLSKNTRNAHPKECMTLQIQAEISKKRTNFVVFATAKRRDRNVHELKRARKKKNREQQHRSFACGKIRLEFRGLNQPCHCGAARWLCGWFSRC